MNATFLRSISFSFSLLLVSGSLIGKDEAEKYDLRKALGQKNLIGCAVIGAGPAGSAAGLYLGLLGIPGVMFTGPIKGGQLTETSYIENYPGVKKIEGTALIDIMHDQVRDFNTKIIEESIVEVDFKQWPFVLKSDSGKEYRALSVIATTGSIPKKLGVPGEEEYWGNGVSSCAKCDCLFFRNQHVLIVGGGNKAVEEAMQLSPYAKTVTMLVRSDRMRAVHHVQNYLKGYPNVEIIYNKQVTKVIGDGEKVVGFEVRDTQTGEQMCLRGDGLFLAIGYNSLTELFEGQLDLSDDGYILVQGRTQATSEPGVFAAGDVEDSIYRQAGIAAGDGIKAAIDAATWLRELGLDDASMKVLGLRPSAAAA